jgi:hypothetical protein
MDQSVGGPPDGGVQRDGVVEGRVGPDPAGSEVLFDELDDPFAGSPRVPQQLGQGRGRESRAWQGQAERLGQDLTGAGATHKLAGPTGGVGPMLGDLKVLPRHLAALHRRPHRPHVVGRDVVGGIQLGSTRKVDGGQVAPGDRHQMRRDRLVITGDSNQAVMGMPQGMDLHHGRHDVGRDQRVAHAVGGLHHPIADVAHGKHRRFAAGLRDTVVYFLDRRTIGKRARMAHAVGALDQNLRLAQIFIRPVHSQTKGITLLVDTAESLTPQASCIW